MVDSEEEEQSSVLVRETLLIQIRSCLSVLYLHTHTHLHTRPTAHPETHTQGVVLLRLCEFHQRREAVAYVVW